MHTLTKIEHLLYHLNGKPNIGLNCVNADITFQIQLWFYLPPSKLSADNTVIYTVGLSQKRFDSPCPFIELSFQVPGKHRRSQLEKLGTILGEFIYDTLKVTHFIPNLLLTGLKRQFMPGMLDMMVLEGAGIRPLWIEIEKDINIRILQLLPVNEKETPMIKQMGVWNTYRSFIQQKINFLEPNRKSLIEPYFHKDELKLAREVAVYDPRKDVSRLLDEIRYWYQMNASQIPAAVIGLLPDDIHNWPEFFGLLHKNHQVDIFKDEGERLLWLRGHCEALYSGMYLPDKNNLLSLNPNFFPPE